MNWNNVWADDLTENPFSSIPANPAFTNPFQETENNAEPTSELIETTPEEAPTPVIDPTEAIADTVDEKLPGEESVEPMVQSDPADSVLPEPSDQTEIEPKEKLEDLVIPNPLFGGDDQWSKQSITLPSDETPLGILHSNRGSVNSILQDSNQIPFATDGFDTNDFRSTIPTDGTPLGIGRDSLNSIQDANLTPFTTNGFDSPFQSDFRSSTNQRVSKGPMNSSRKSSLKATQVLIDPLNALGFGEPEPQETTESQSETWIGTESNSTYTYDVAVLDPLKGGDVLSGYVEYRVTCTSTHTSYPNPSSVMRRYSDFLWLFNQLLYHNMGVIIPPIPEKQTLGRFQDAFINKRRIQLDRFLKGVAAHPILQNDLNFFLFLTSQDFSKVKKERGIAGVLGTVTPQNGTSLVAPADGHGLLFSKLQSLQNLESRLKQLAKVLNVMNTQNRELNNAVSELGNGFLNLGMSKILGRTSEKINSLGRIHKAISQINNPITVAMSSTVDECLRKIGVIKLVLAIRNKMYAQLSTMEKRLEESKQGLEATSKVRTDKVENLRTEFLTTQERVEKTSIEFSRMTDTLIDEICEFEKQEIFITSVKEMGLAIRKVQQEALEIWKSYKN